MKVNSLLARSAVAIAALLMFGLAAAQDDGISWDELSDGQREILSQLESSWDTLPAERQRRLSTGAKRWAGMSRQERQQARGRFQSWRELSDERRELISERAQIFRRKIPEHLRTLTNQLTPLIGQFAPRLKPASCLLAFLSRHAGPTFRAPG